MPRQVGRKDLTALEKLEIIAFLKLYLKPDGKVVKGKKGEAADRYQCHRNTIAAIWNNRGSVSSARAGSRPRLTDEELMEVIEAVPVHERTTVRSTAAAAGLSAATVGRNVGKGRALARRAARLKPALTTSHMEARLRFVLQFVERPTCLRTLRFHDMYDTVHLDEKWFYVYKDKMRYILTARERAPHRSCSSKRFITKIMFRAAVARPRYNYSTRTGFDGKLGIFPIMEERVAKRTTKNQTKGEKIATPVNVDKNVYAKLLVEKVLPAIQTRWPGKRQGTIYLQQDNASPHVTAEEAIKNSVLAKYGWDIQIRRQPAKSPDLNILDLGYFHAIQSLQHKKRAYSVYGLIQAVSESFSELEVRTLDKCFLTLQAVMEKVMLAGGSNDYDLPRVKKRHFPDGPMPSALVCSQHAVNNATRELARLEKVNKKDAK